MKAKFQKKSNKKKQSKISKKKKKKKKAKQNLKKKKSINLIFVFRFSRIGNLFFLDFFFGFHFQTKGCHPVHLILRSGQRESGGRIERRDAWESLGGSIDMGNG